MVNIEDLFCGKTDDKKVAEVCLSNGDFVSFRKVKVSDILYLEGVMAGKPTLPTFNVVVLLSRICLVNDAEVTLQYFIDLDIENFLPLNTVFRRISGIKNTGVV